MWEEMRPLSPTTVLATACISSVILHEFLFRRFEFDNYAVKIGGLVILTYFILTSSFRLFSAEYNGALQAHAMASLALTSFVLSLWTSMLVYRAFFHPLRNFPGPFGARLSKFWSVNQSIRTGFRFHHVLGQLKEKYGDYVRTGPREIVIFDAAAINPVLGSASKTSRGPAYNAMELTLFFTRSKDFHRRRRKVFDTAFKQSLSDYGPRVEEFTDSLLVRIGKNVGKPISINEIVVHYSYDVMSAMAFGKAMGFVKGDSNEDANQILANLQKWIFTASLGMHVPWLMNSLTSFTSFGGPMKQFYLWSEKQVTIRTEMKVTKPDVFGYLYDATEHDSAGMTMLYAETRMLMAAGSDTTATALTNIFIHLALYPEWHQRLQDEADEVFAAKTYSCLRPLPVLDAIINEVMRIQPSLFFSSQRVTPPEGMTIGETYIPGDTVISIPAYWLNHDERNFVHANEFRPERWLDAPELILNKGAFIPFLIGAYNCVGRNLAMMELHSVVLRTVYEFNVEFPPGPAFDPVDYYGRVRDYFVACLPQQDLVFTPRQS